MALDRNRRDPVDRRRFDGRPVVLPGRHSHYVGVFLLVVFVIYKRKFGSSGHA
jgi:hypothetical protein